MKNYMGYVSVDKLLDYANNQKDHMLDANDIARFPTADVAPVVHAHWTNTIDRWHDGETYCSACGGEAGAEYGRYTYLETEYCPHCGARMDEQENSKNKKE